MSTSPAPASSLSSSGGGPTDAPPAENKRLTIREAIFNVIMLHVFLLQIRLTLKCMQHVMNPKSLQ